MAAGGACPLLCAGFSERAPRDEDKADPLRHLPRDSHRQVTGLVAIGRGIGSGWWGRLLLGSKIDKYLKSRTIVNLSFSSVIRRNIPPKRCPAFLENRGSVTHSSPLNTNPHKQMNPEIKLQE